MILLAYFKKIFCSYQLVLLLTSKVYHRCLVHGANLVTGTLAGD